MGLFKTFKALSTLNNAINFVEDNKKYIESVKQLIEKVVVVIDFLKEKVAAAEAVVRELKELIKK